MFVNIPNMKIEVKLAVIMKLDIMGLMSVGTSGALWLVGYVLLNLSGAQFDNTHKNIKCAYILI